MEPHALWEKSNHHVSKGTSKPLNTSIDRNQKYSTWRKWLWRRWIWSWAVTRETRVLIQHQLNCAPVPKFSRFCRKSFQEPCSRALLVGGNIAVVWTANRCWNNRIHFSAQFSWQRTDIACSPESTQTSTDLIRWVSDWLSGRRNQTLSYTKTWSDSSFGGSLPDWVGAAHQADRASIKMIWKPSLRNHIPQKLEAWKLYDDSFLKLTILTAILEMMMPRQR